MTNEKPNKSSDWINKLDELESIQGAPFNKEASWNKLYERLYSKSNKRKAIWYWLAAACLFFALFISLFISHNKENVLVKNNLRENKNVSPFVQHMPVINKDTSPIVSSLLVNKKLFVHPIHKIDKRNTDIQHDMVSKKIGENKKEEGIGMGLSSNAVMPVDTAISIVYNSPEKKKLKVVHINELGDPVSEAPNLARYYEQHSFQFKFMNQEVYTRFSPAVSKTGFKIFTTKNPTN